jgi:hypothetical protein
MKKLAILFITVCIVSCTSTKTNRDSRPLFEVLIASEYGGASFQFYEIVTEPNEFKMLLNDEEIKPFVKKGDIETSNFILLNMGEKTSGGYRFKIEKVEELPDKVVITVKEIGPKPKQLVTNAMTNPYSVVKINSKKPIEIK